MSNPGVAQHASALEEKRRKLEELKKRREARGADTARIIYFTFAALFGVERKSVSSFGIPVSCCLCLIDSLLIDPPRINSQSNPAVGDFPCYVTRHAVYVQFQWFLW